MKDDGGSLKRFSETSRLLALIQSLTFGIFEGLNERETMHTERKGVCRYSSDEGR
jgi:hypothetical protein